VVREVAAVFGVMTVLDITILSRNARMLASSIQFKFFRGSLPQRVQRAILVVSRSEYIGQMLDSAMMNGRRAVRIGGLDQVPGQFGPFARQTGTKIQGV
jgi:hypothetical protein